LIGQDQRGRNMFRPRLCLTTNLEDTAVQRFSDQWNRFVREEEGATMVEYGLMVALIAVVCIAAVTLVGSSLSTLFTGVSTNVSNAGT